MPRQLRVFLCHASQDKPAVRELYKRLKDEEWIDPWLDKAKILAGQDWELVIEKAVDESDVVIVCLSSQSISKEGFVQREIRYAYDIALEKPEETIFLIPLRLDNCNVPRKLRSLHWVDYFDSQEQKDEAFFNLLESLKYRYGQILQLEAEELERRRLEVKARQEADDLIKKLTFEKAERENEERVALEKLNDVIAEETLQEDAQRDEVKEADKIKADRRIIDIRRAGIIVIILFLFVFGGLGLNSLFSQSTNDIITPTLQVFTKTFETHTETKISFAPTFTETSIPVSPTLTPGIGSTMVSEKDGMTLVFVPEGEFTMGSGNDEHQVNLDAFWIDQTEVTNARYARCVADGNCEPPSSSSSYTHNSYYGNSTYDDYPVIYINWSQSAAYCKWVGRELPTEAQWEKAARGTDGRTYPWGESISCDYTNFYSDNKFCIGDTSVVGNYQVGASIYGALDMAGNVWEWVSSLYQDYPYDENDGRENLSASGSRVLRGGSWNDYYNSLHSAFRGRNDPAYTGYYVGFRCSLSRP